jgi:hypothetical protein
LYTFWILSAVVHRFCKRFVCACKFAGQAILGQASYLRTTLNSNRCQSLWWGSVKKQYLCMWGCLFLVLKAVEPFFCWRQMRTDHLRWMCWQFPTALSDAVCYPWKACFCFVEMQHKTL